MRTHVILPDETVSDIDGLVGKGKRSKFIEEAIQEKLKKEKQLKAIRESFGAISPSDYPHWSTPQKTDEWVRQLRDESDRTLSDKWRTRE